MCLYVQSAVSNVIREFFLSFPSKTISRLSCLLIASESQGEKITQIGTLQVKPIDNMKSVTICAWMLEISLSNIRFLHIPKHSCTVFPTVKGLHFRLDTIDCVFFSIFLTLRLGVYIFSPMYQELHTIYKNSLIKLVHQKKGNNYVNKSSNMPQRHPEKLSDRKAQLCLHQNLDLLSKTAHLRTSLTFPLTILEVTNIKVHWHLWFYEEPKSSM